MKQPSRVPCRSCNNDAENFNGYCELCEKERCFQEGLIEIAVLGQEVWAGPAFTFRRTDSGILRVNAPKN